MTGTKGAVQLEVMRVVQKCTAERQQRFLNINKNKHVYQQCEFTQEQRTQHHIAVHLSIAVAYLAMFINFDAPASTWMPSPPRRPAVTLTHNHQNLTRSSVGLLNILRKFHRDCPSRS